MNTNTGMLASPYTLDSRTLMLRGIVSILFGIFALVWPISGLLALVITYGAYAFVDGVSAMATGIKQGRQKKRWGLPFLEGVFGIGTGIVTLFWPGITLYVLSILVGAWAFSTGILELLAAFKLGGFMPRAAPLGRLLLGLAGVFSIILGITIFFIPALGSVTLLTFVASYSLIFGTLILGLGVRLHRDSKVTEETAFPKAA